MSTAVCTYIGTPCARGLGLRPQDSLSLWPWALPSGLAALVASIQLRPQDLLRSWPCSGFALRTCCSRNFCSVLHQLPTPGAMCEVPLSLWRHLTHQRSHSITKIPGGLQLWLRRGRDGCGAMCEVPPSLWRHLTHQRSAPYGSYVRCSPHHGSQNDKLNLYY